MDYKADFEKATKYKLGRRIYSGDGVIFQIKGSPNRLVKIVDGSLDRYKVISKICKAKNGSVVKIFDHGIIKAPSAYNKKAYYYVMEKLKPLPQNNDSDELVNLIENSSWSKTVPFYFSDKLKKFISQSKKLKFSYSDFHSGNIMLDRYGNFKYIDLESFAY